MSDPWKLPVPNLISLRRPVAALGLFAAVLLAACGPATLPQGDLISDPGEAQNRAVHRFNLALDQAVVGPTARGYGSVVPEPLRQGVDNFAANLSQPSYVLNNLLQVRIGQATQNVLRFMINSTIGIGGIFDPATAMGLPAAQTDFGQTLHLWGTPEGNFVMLPGFGPSTSRDTVGLIVDMATNPVRQVVPQADRHYVTGVQILNLLGDRYEVDDVMDGLIYGSADSYAQLRTLYLQRRRFALADGAPALDGAADDIYADPYVDPY
jgi:phospholipid-binding lipoprotein MlaA